MEGKISTLFRFAEYLLMCEPDRLKLVYEMCDEKLDVFDKLHLCKIGIPAKDFKTKEDVKVYVIYLGMMYIHANKESVFRAFNKLTKKIIYENSRTKIRRILDV